MNSKDVTITDVALHAGVSIATVSRVINNSQRVDPASAKKVREAMIALQYVPSIRKKSKEVFAVVVPSLENPFFSNVVEGIMTLANKLQKTIVVYSSEGKSKQEQLCLQNAASLGISGLMFCPSSEENKLLVSALFSHCLPKVIMYRRSYIPEATHVYYNNETGGYLAAKYLLEGGHRNIAFFASFWETPAQDMQTLLDLLDSPNRGSYSSLDRLCGYKRALKEYGLEIDSRYLSSSGYSYCDGYEMTMQFLSRSLEFTAIICSNDTVAAGAIQALREQNIAVPQQVSVIGYDDSYLTNVTAVALSSIAQDPKHLGSVAFSELQNLVRGKKNTDIVLEPSLVIRSSSMSII